LRRAHRRMSPPQDGSVSAAGRTKRPGLPGRGSQPVKHNSALPPPYETIHIFEPSVAEKDPPIPTSVFLRPSRQYPPAASSSFDVAITKTKNRGWALRRACESDAARPAIFRAASHRSAEHRCFKNPGGGRVDELTLGRPSSKRPLFTGLEKKKQKKKKKKKKTQKKKKKMFLRQNVRGHITPSSIRSMDVLPASLQRRRCAQRSARPRARLCRTVPAGPPQKTSARHSSGRKQTRQSFGQEPGQPSRKRPRQRRAPQAVCRSAPVSSGSSFFFFIFSRRQSFFFHCHQGMSPRRRVRMTAECWATTAALCCARHSAPRVMGPRRRAIPVNVQPPSSNNERTPSNNPKQRAKNYRIRIYLLVPFPK